MPFHAAGEVAPLTVLESVPSTNDAVDASAPDFSTWVTLDQTAGRGRLGREWIAPAGRTLAASVLIRPTTPRATWGWMPLAAGLALANAIDPLVAGGATVKWPNDVQIDGRKVAGILCELRDDAIVVGFGVNLDLADDELPVPTATSLTREGAEGSAAALADSVLAHALSELRLLTPRLGERALRTAIESECSTLGTDVRVELPGGDVLTGRAVGLGPGGELAVESAGGLRLVAAGDVTHVR